MSGTPPGFVYHPDFLTPAEARAVLAGVTALEYHAVKMRGQVARRRTTHFGWTYGYETWRIEPGPPIPDFLLALRGRAAAVGGVSADDLEEVLVTHYPPGAGIGWHRDAPMFGVVIGVSLVSACRFRFQRGKGAARLTASAALEPRSAYALDGPARWQWQHSIPPAKTERYSVTYRTLRRRPLRER
ncbi:MAG TPA: alpha-ketoglutarate-dependent dioxygenase AlkB [Methylomirabilota bacterium]